MRGCSRVRIRSPWIQRRPDTDAALLWRKDSCYIWKLLKSIARQCEKAITLICLSNGSQYCKRRLLVVFCKGGGRRGAYISHLSWTPLFQQLAFWLRNFRNNLWLDMVLYIQWDYSSSIGNIRGNVCWEDGRVYVGDFVGQIIAKPNFVLLGWQHPETSEMSPCSRTKRCPRIMYWVIPVVYLTVPDILMAR